MEPPSGNEAQRRAREPAIDADPTGAHICEEYETTCHSDILEEHEVLHLIGLTRMKDERRQEAVNRERGRNHTCLIAYCSEHTRADLEYDHGPEQPAG